MKTLFISYLLLVNLGLIEFDCKDNSYCPPDSFCQKEPGDCDGLGVCVRRPGACIALWDPVCGCDGRTYGNACEAAAAGVSVNYPGLCITASCRDNSDCPLDYFCAKAQGDCGGLGTCTKKPTVCPDVWDPVCGCDGQTYANACYAACFGINVAHKGECPTLCSDNGECPEGYYCAKATGDCKGTGVCTKKPLVCPDVWDPVCGCNFQTYGNACEAAADGVNVRYAGPCKAVCVNPPLADLNGDCWVDMQDLALFARDWLSCGLDAPEYCFDMLP